MCVCETERERESPPLYFNLQSRSACLLLCSTPTELRSVPKMMIKCSNYCSFHYTECSHLFCHTTLSVWVLRQGNLCILISFICCSSRPSAGIIIDIWSCGEPVERGCIIQLRLCHSLWQMMKSLSGGNKHNNISYHVIPLYCNHIYHTPESTAPWAVPPPLLAAPLSYIYSIYRHIHIHIHTHKHKTNKVL